MAVVETIEVELKGKGIENLIAALNKVADSCKKASTSSSKFGADIRKAGREATKGSSLFSKLQSSIIGLAKSIARIGFYRAIRSMIKSITDSFSIGIENVYRFSQIVGSTFANTMDNMATKSLTMKNQLGAALSALLSAAMPILLQLIDLITRAANAITAFISAFSGGTYLKAKDTFTQWKDDAKAGAAATKEWKNQLLGFDEINRLEEPTSSGGGGGSSIPDYSKMFEEVAIPENIKTFVEWLKENMDEILKIAEAIGLAIIAWNAMVLLTQLPTILGKLLAFLAPLLTIAGLALSIYSYMKMWENGINWKNLAGFILGVELATLGVFIAFGSVAAGITMVLGGLALLIVGFHEWISTGNLSTETMAAIVAGFLLIGGAIALMTGSWIPLVIAAVASAAVVIAKYWNEIVSFIASCVNGIIDALNWLISGFNAVNEFFGGNPNYVGKISHVTWGSPAYATGGFPEDGMFFANSGELVGQFDNGKTAVANNEQIIAGLRQGVYEATLAAINNGNLPTAEDVRESKSEVYLDGAKISKSLNKYSRAMGT